MQTEGPVLVFAGAGSGKTRVLTHRIAYLIKEKSVRPWNILAVTFTNKAANEMKDRIANLLGQGANGLWAGTFHGTCARILREQSAAAGVDRNFTIYDDYDQIQLVKEAMEAEGIDQKVYKPRAILDMISRAKEQLVSPEEFGRRFVGSTERVAERVYKAYQDKLKLNRALDFDDLIMYTVLLFRDQPDVLAHYQDRFRYVLVDEYQDINFSQYTLVHNIAAKHRNIFCVGDDDQSIYRWRGADVRMILQFEKDYPDAAVFKLERNYRSTKKILEAAHAVIRLNVDRAEKKLWTENEEGADIEILAAANEIEEAELVARSIQDKVSFGGRSYNDIVVLYRMNAQSRVFEEAMIRYRIPHRLVGTVRFYERREIKDVIAYLRLAANPHESVSLRRVINVPARGIGQTSMSRLEQFAISERITIFEALQRVREATEIPTKARNAMQKFAEIIRHLNEMRDAVSVRKLTEEVLIVTGYLDALAEERTMEARTRIENVQELLSVTESYQNSTEEPTLAGFLEQVALISDIDTLDESGNAVTLMTLHSAKGLEFPVVYIVGLEEGVFPHRRSFDDPEEMAEERRLCYVGMTRAQQELILSYAHQRMLMGQVSGLDVSRFIQDIPEQVLANTLAVRRRRIAAADVTWKRDFQPRRTPSTATYRPAQRVFHEQFGRGIVLNCSGSGDDEVVTVAFDDNGVKKLQVTVARLRAV